MRSRKSSRIAGAATIAIAALTGLLTLSGGVASAITVPPYPATGVYPNWFTAGTTPGTHNGTETASNIIRGAGSDTTFFMMQQLGDLYSQAGLYGCTLIGSGTGQNANCDDTGSGPNYSDTATTDTSDNFNRTEVLQGVNSIGSGTGQSQLCGTVPSPQAVDYARSSKPAGSACTMVQLGYAKDSIPAIDFQSVDPAAVGTPTYFNGKTFNTSGSSANPAFPTAASTNTTPCTAACIGAVAAGWLPGDPTNCVPSGEGLSGTPCSGTPFNDIDNGGNGTSPTGASSIAYRIWCATDSTRITDWGQLTNLSASGPGNGGTAKTVGNGAPIGVPIRVIGINPGSGTVATFSSYAESGVSGGGCSVSGTLMDTNAASGPNPLVSNGVTGNLEIAVENNASQIGDFAAADFANDPADQAVELATSLYAESYGVNLSNPNAGTESLEPGTGTVPAGVPLSYTATVMNEDNQTPTIANERTNNYPTARTLFNIFRPATLRASTAGFLQWICDSNSAIHKKTDLTTGVNFDQEITNVINNNFEFSRLNDNTTELAANKLTPADGLTSPNSSCDATLGGIVATGTTSVTYEPGGTATNVPSPAAFAVGQSAKGVNVPANTTVVSVSGSTITFNNSIPSTVTSIYFPGMGPVLAVANANT